MLIDDYVHDSEKQFLSPHAEISYQLLYFYDVSFGQNQIYVCFYMYSMKYIFFPANKESDLSVHKKFCVLSEITLKCFHIILGNKYYTKWISFLLLWLTPPLFYLNEGTNIFPNIFSLFVFKYQGVFSFKLLTVLRKPSLLPQAYT